MQIIRLKQELPAKGLVSPARYTCWQVIMHIHRDDEAVQLFFNVVGQRPWFFIVFNVSTQKQLVLNNCLMLLGRNLGLPRLSFSNSHCFLIQHNKEIADLAAPCFPSPCLIAFSLKHNRKIAELALPAFLLHALLLSY